MPNSDSQFLSRRKWLGLTPTIAAASFGSGLLAARALADDQIPMVPANANPNSSSTDNLLGAKIYNVRDFGAKGDKETLDTKAVQDAVDACFKDGGGTGLVPAGIFQIGMIELKSNVTLHISAGATLLGTGDGKQYHDVEAVPLEGDATAGDGDVGLIYAVKANNVTVEGPGTIDGQGLLFQHKRNDPNPSPSGVEGRHRPYHLMFYQCTNVRVRDIYLKDCAFHSMRVFQCNYCWFDGIHLWSRVNSNNDGFHFISCEYVHISNCDIQCQDDACALFGSCKFVTVTNSSFSTRWSVFRFGGGVAENITVSNCRRRALAIPKFSFHQHRDEQCHRPDFHQYGLATLSPAWRNVWRKWNQQRRGNKFNDDERCDKFRREKFCCRNEQFLFANESSG
jgi:polygalacturonase